MYQTIKVSAREMALRLALALSSDRIGSAALASDPPPSLSLLSLSEIGFGLTLFGSLFLVLGVLLFFDKALLALGNVRDSAATAGLLLACQRSPASSLAHFSPSSSVHVQLLFLAGTTLLIGARRTFVLFSRPSKWRGTACFLGGIALVLIGATQNNSRSGEASNVEGCAR